MSKSILITGGTGSFGKNCAYYLLNKYKTINKLVLFSRDELKQSELKKVKSELKKAQQIEKQLRKEEDKDVFGTIVSVKKTGNYKIDITLDNGQVWRSLDSVYKRLPVKKSQKVTISKAVISGHILRVTGKKVAIRVRKIR